MTTMNRITRGEPGSESEATQEEVLLFLALDASSKESLCASEKIAFVLNTMRRVLASQYHSPGVCKN